jgi:hypothetical protein
MSPWGRPMLTPLNLPRTNPVRPRAKRLKTRSQLLIDTPRRRISLPAKLLPRHDTGSGNTGNLPFRKNTGFARERMVPRRRDGASSGDGAFPEALDARSNGTGTFQPAPGGSSRGSASIPVPANRPSPVLGNPGAISLEKAVETADYAESADIEGLAGKCGFTRWVR